MKSRRPKRILVAGGAGFVGSHLCERLVGDGHLVTCIDNFVTGNGANLAWLSTRPTFELIDADIAEPLTGSIARRSFDEIYNLACPASPPLYQRDPEHTLLTSVFGTRQLLRLAESCGGRLLLASTSEIYGDPLVHPQVESYWGNVNCTGPRACYDEGKRAAETLCFDFDRTGRAETRVARIFNTYGPRLSADDGRVVSNIVTQALSGAEITVYGDGSQTRSFCYVDDLVEGLMRLMACPGPQPGPVNLGNPHERTVCELVRLVVDLTGSSSKVIHLRLPQDDPRRRRPDISRARRLLDWTPRVALEHGLRHTIAWFEEGTSRARRPVTRGAALASG